MSTNLPGKFRPHFVLLSTLVMLTLLTNCSRSDVPTSRLFEFLQYIPDTEIYRQWIAYGDSSAWLNAWNIEKPERGDVRNLENADFTFTAALTVWQRQTNPPQSLGVQWSAVEDQVGLLGFNAFLLDQYIEAGMPPDAITVAEFGFNKKQIGDSLTKLGYRSDEMDGGTLYSLRGDYEMDIQSPIKSIRFPLLNRILLTNGRMVIGNATEVVKNAQSAHSGETASLAKNATYVAMAQALEDVPAGEYGEMLGVIMMNGETIDESITLQLKNIPVSQLGDYYQTALPAFDLAGFATYQKDKTSFLTLVLVFPKGADSQSAAEILAERLQNYTSLTIRESLGDIWTIEKATGSTINDLPVAIVVMRSDATEVLGPTGTSLRVFTWGHLVVRRDILFLAMER